MMARDSSDEQSQLLDGESRGYGIHQRSTSWQGDVEENRSLPRSTSSKPTPDFDFKAQWKKNLVLLLGVFLVNSDSAILLSIFRQIASEFDELSSASWLVTSYIIGVIVSQPLFGKLSDLYGRKPLLIFTYACTCVGGLISGIGFSFWGVILGRAIGGIGNAGMSVLISTLIVDLVPIREVALWRSFVYATNQIGRASGLPLGGIITDSSNWRWALLYQVPITFVSLIFIWWKMPFPKPQHDKDEDETEDESHKSKLKRIDFGGAISLGLANCSLLLVLDQAPKTVDVLQNLKAVIPAVTWVIFLALFVFIESCWTREPILPLRLLANRNVLSAYAIQFLQAAAQLALFTSVPLYFRVTANDTNSLTSLRLLFITAGTIIATLSSGYFITKTGLYRTLIRISQILSLACFTAIFLLWRGHTTWPGTLLALPVGLGFGVSLSATFIALTDGLPTSQVAVATSGFYLCLNMGSEVGVGMSSALVQAGVQTRLRNSLRGIPDRELIIHKVTSSIDNLNRLAPRIRRLAVAAYTRSLVQVWLFALVCTAASLLASALLRKEQLDDPKGKGKGRAPARRKASASMVARAKRRAQWMLFGRSAEGGGQSRIGEEGT